MPTHDPGNQPKQKPAAPRPQNGGQLQSAQESALGRRGQIAPQQLTPRDVLQLQRTIGNRAVAQLLGRQSPPVQRTPAPAQPIEMPSAHFAERRTSSNAASQEFASNSTTEGIIQRVIDPKFSESGQTADQATLLNFYKVNVLAELKTAMKSATEPHLKLMEQWLKDADEKFKQRFRNAVQYDYPKNWQLAVEALDDLVGMTNRVNKESSRPGMWIDEGNESLDWTPIPGPMTQEGVLDNWGYDPQDVLNPQDYISFYHSTTAKGKIEGSQVIIMGGAKEFGEGFYTTASDIDAPAKKIGDEWFTKKQENPDWVIIRFSIPKNYTTFLHSQNPVLNIFLNYVLTHSSGFPSGGAQPDATDLQNINAINLEGRVLIFPNDKSTKVQTTMGDKSWDDYTEHKLGGGSYELVIGPQQPAPLHRL